MRSVVMGSHRAAQLDRQHAERLRAERAEMVIPARRGGALIMRPLILHASSKGTTKRLRRVLHFVYGPRQLPRGLAWRIAV